MHPLPLISSLSPPTQTTLLPLTEKETASSLGSQPLPFANNSQHAIQTTYSQSLQMQQSGSTALQVKTQDGDTITLLMQTQWQVAMAYSEQQSAATQSPQSALQHTQGYAIHYQIEGELDPEEQQALDQVMEQLSVTTQHFFSGDLAGAIRSLEDFQMDSEEFASLSVTLQRSVSYSMAERYQEVGELTPTQPPVRATAGGLIGLSDFINNLFQMMDKVNEGLEPIVMPEQFIQQLMEQAIDRDPRSSELPESLMSSVETFLEQMTEQWKELKHVED